MASTKISDFLKSINFNEYIPSGEHLNKLTDKVHLFIEKQEKPQYLKNKDLDKFNELLKITDNHLYEPITPQNSSNTYIYIKHLSDNIIRPSTTLTLSGCKPNGAVKMFKKLYEHDTDDNWYVLCIVYGILPDTKTININNVIHDSLRLGKGNNYDAEPFYGGSLSYKLRGDNLKLYETPNKAILREGYEEIGREINNNFFRNKNDFIKRQNQNLTYYVTTPKDYKPIKNEYYQTKDKNMDCNGAVKAIVYGECKEMCEFLDTCKPHDSNEMISCYAIIKLSELVKAYEKVGKDTVVVINYHGDKMNLREIPKFTIY